MSKSIVLRLDLTEAERQALLAGLYGIEPPSVRRFMSASDLEKLIQRLKGER